MTAANYTPPELKREPYTLPDGVEVSVRQLRLTERLTIRREVAALPSGQDPEASLVVMVPRLLARAVELNGAPLMTAEQWDNYGAGQPTAALELFNLASDLSGFNAGAAEKN